MFMIERFMETIRMISPRLTFIVRIDNDGYRIVINDYITTDREDREKFLQEKILFMEMLKQEKNIHILKICDGRTYIIKVIVIIKALYDGNNIYLGLPSKIQKIEDINWRRKREIEDYLNIIIEDI